MKIQVSKPSSILKPEGRHACAESVSVPVFVKEKLAEGNCEAECDDDATRGKTTHAWKNHGPLRVNRRKGLNGPVSFDASVA